MVDVKIGVLDIVDESKELDVHVEATPVVDEEGFGQH